MQDGLALRILSFVERNPLSRDPVLAQMVKQLVQEFSPERIYLFGSRARGDEGPDSDYDLFVLVERASEPGYKLAQRAHRCIRDLGVSADVLVWTKDAFDRRAHLLASLPGTVLREGVLLHAA